MHGDFARTLYFWETSYELLTFEEYTVGKRIYVHSMGMMIHMYTTRGKNFSVKMNHEYGPVKVQNN